MTKELQEGKYLGLAEIAISIKDQKTCSKGCPYNSSAFLEARDICVLFGQRRELIGTHYYRISNCLLIKLTHRIACKMEAIPLDEEESDNG